MPRQGGHVPLALARVSPNEERGQIRAMLLPPTLAVDLVEFTTRWFETDIVWRLEGGGERPQDPAFPREAPRRFWRNLCETVLDRSILACEGLPPRNSDGELALCFLSSCR
jgi:hypothetical protein